MWIGERENTEEKDIKYLREKWEILKISRVVSLKYSVMVIYNVCNMYVF